MTTQCAWCVAAGRVERIEGASDTICEPCLEEHYPEDLTAQKAIEERGR